MLSTFFTYEHANNSYGCGSSWNSLGGIEEIAKRIQPLIYVYDKRNSHLDQYCSGVGIGGP